MSGRNTFADNRTAGILTQMNHLRARIRLLVVIRHCHTIEFSRRVISRQNTGRVFPRNSRTCLHLCPGEFTVRTFAVTTFRNEVIDTAFAFGITRIPVLYGTVLHFRTLMYHNFHDSGMQLVLIAHRSRTTFQIGNIRIIIRHNQRPLKLACITRIDTEIRGQLHRTAYPFRDIYKRTVGEYRRVQCSKEVITVSHNGTKILLHQIRMLTYSFTDGTENDSFLHQRFLERSLHRYRVHHSIYGHATQCHLFFQGNTQLIEGFYQLRVYLVHTLRSIFLLRQRIGIVGNSLIIYLRNTEMCPCRHLHRQPVTICFQTELQQPFRLVLLRRDQPYNIFIQPTLNDFRMHVGGEAVLVLLLR